MLNVVAATARVFLVVAAGIFVVASAARVLVGCKTGILLLVTSLESMVVMSRVVGAGRSKVARGSLALGLLLWLGTAARLAPTALKNAAANATSRFEVGSVLIKSFGEMVIAGGSGVATRSIVVVAMDEVG